MNDGNCMPISIHCVTSKILLNKIFCRLQKALSTQNSTILFYNSYNPFFSVWVFFCEYWRFTGQQEKGGNHFFLFPNSTRLPRFRHLFTLLPLRCLPCIFKHITCSYYRMFLMRFNHIWKLPVLIGNYFTI